METLASTQTVPDFTSRWINLADPRLGAAVLSASDEFFAPRERLINPEPPIFIPGKYDENGKWMDGWETRRKRTTGNDHCIIKLGLPGVIKGLDIDTSHFTGNYPPAAAIEVAHCDGEPDDSTDWVQLTTPIPLRNVTPDGGWCAMRKIAAR